VRKFRINRREFIFLNKIRGAIKKILNLPRPFLSCICAMHTKLENCFLYSLCTEFCSRLGLKNFSFGSCNSGHCKSFLFWLWQLMATEKSFMFWTMQLKATVKKLYVLAVTSDGHRKKLYALAFAAEDPMKNFMFWPLEPKATVKSFMFWLLHLTATEKSFMFWMLQLPATVSRDRFGYS
jgi:hypothetical protein